MIVSTQAIVARMLPFSETSRVVIWLTRDYGRIATLIKGADRRRSAFRGQFDLFYTCELLFYHRTVQGLHIARECAPLKPRSALRNGWRGMAGASYVTGLTARVCLDQAPHAGLFDLLDEGLDAFAGLTALEPALYWYELRLMAMLGQAPHLGHCVACRPAPGARGAWPLVFCSARGGLLCQRCAAGVTAPVLPLSAPALGLLRYWQQAHAWETARRATGAPAQFRDIDRVLEAFLAYHLELSPPGRRIALDLLRLPAAPPAA